MKRGGEPHPEMFHILDIPQTMGSIQHNSDAMNWGMEYSLLPTYIWNVFQANGNVQHNYEEM